MGIFDDIEDGRLGEGAEVRALWARLHPEQAERMRQFDLLQDAHPAVREELEEFRVGGGRDPVYRVPHPDDVSPEARALYEQLHPEDAVRLQRIDLFEGADGRLRHELETAASNGSARRLGSPDEIEIRRLDLLSPEGRDLYEQLRPEEAARIQRYETLENADPRLRHELEQAAEGGNLARRAVPDGEIEVRRLDLLSPEARDLYEQLRPDEAARIQRYETLENADPELRHELEQAVAGGGARGFRPDGEIEIRRLDQLSPEGRDLYEQLRPDEAARIQRYETLENADPELRHELENAAGGGGMGRGIGPDGEIEIRRLDQLSPEGRDLYEQLRPDEAARILRYETLENADPELRHELERAVTGGGARGFRPDGEIEVADLGSLSPEALRLYEQLRPDDVDRVRGYEALRDADPALRAEIAEVERVFGATGGPPEPIRVDPRTVPPLEPAAGDEPAEPAEPAVVGAGPTPEPPPDEVEMMDVELPPELRNELVDPDGDGIGQRVLRTEAYAAFDPDAATDATAAEVLGLVAADEDVLGFVADEEVAAMALTPLAAEVAPEPPEVVEPLAGVDAVPLAAGVEVEPVPEPVVEVIEVVGSDAVFDIELGRDMTVTLPPPEDDAEL